MFALTLLAAALAPGGCGSGGYKEPASITVGAYFEREPEPYEEIGPEGTFLVVEVQVENSSEGPLYTNLGAAVGKPGDQYVYFMLNDSEGRVYAEALIAEREPFLPDSLDPGQAARGNVTFYVPRDWTALTLIAKTRVVPRYGEEREFFRQELLRSGLSEAP